MFFPTDEKHPTARLDELASIQVGYTFRAGLSPDAEGDVCVIQLKDVPEDDIPTFGSLTRIAFGAIREAHRVLPGDILFRSRGTRPSCALVSTIQPETMLAAPLFRIRVTSVAIDSAYLCWFINFHGRSHLESRVAGSALKMVGVADLKELPVILPPLKRQHQMAELVRLARREAQILQSISKKRSNLVATSLARALQETHS